MLHNPGGLPVVPTDSLEAKRGLCLSHSNTSQIGHCLATRERAGIYQGAAGQCPIFSAARRRCYEADRGKQAHGAALKGLAHCGF